MPVTASTTYLAKPGELTADWHTVDASGQVLGRLAAKLAVVLQGKHKPTYTPHVDTGDFVVVLNAEKLVVTGAKADHREYQKYTGFPGGLNVTSYKEMIAKKPERVLELAVRRMLPKSKLGRHMLTKLKIYRGGEHPHAAQQPKPLTLN